MGRQSSKEIKMKYLFIGAHVDDIELCCGGYIAKLIEQGHEVHCIALITNIDGHELQNEYFNSMRVLGVKNVHLAINYQVRNLNTGRQRLLDELVKLDPFDYYVTHSSNDIHQDHETVGRESLRAFKKKNLLTYTAEWNQLQSDANYFVELTDEQMAVKIEAIECYQSQKHRPYFNRQHIYSRAILNGAKIGAKYAEAFKIVNMKG